MKIIQADAPTIQMECHPIQTNWYTTSIISNFMPDALPDTTLALDRQQICWLAHPVAIDLWKSHRPLWSHLEAWIVCFSGDPRLTHYYTSIMVQSSTHPITNVFAFNNSKPHGHSQQFLSRNAQNIPCIICYEIKKEINSNWEVL